MTRLAHKSLTAANESADRARAALRAFLSAIDEAEAETIYAAAVVERGSAEDAAREAYDEHRSKALTLPDYADEDSGWYEAHVAWETAAKVWNQIPDSWEN
jgi:hypothetical protein